MPRNEGAIHQALTDAKQHLESLQSEVERYERIVGTLEQASALENGDARLAKAKVVKAKRPYSKRVSVTGDVRTWHDVFKEALSGGILHNRKTLAQAALTLRKSGNREAAYASVVWAIRNGVLVESSGGTITLGSKA